MSKRVSNKKGGASRNKGRIYEKRLPNEVRAALNKVNPGTPVPTAEDPTPIKPTRGVMGRVKDFLTRPIF